MHRPYARNTCGSEYFSSLCALDTRAQTAPTSPRLLQVYIRPIHWQLLLRKPHCVSVRMTRNEHTGNPTKSEVGRETTNECFNWANWWRKFAKSKKEWSYRLTVRNCRIKNCAGSQNSVPVMMVRAGHVRVPYETRHEIVSAHILRAPRCTLTKVATSLRASPSHTFRRQLLQFSIWFPAENEIELYVTIQFVAPSKHATSRL
jgi:hypothetical protein